MSNLELSWWIMIIPWSNDECNFKNLDVDQKWWSLTINWSNLTFCPIQLIFNHLINWLSKLALQGLKFDMRVPWYILGTMKSTWGIRSPISFEKSKTLVVGQLLRKRVHLTNPWEVLSIWSFYEHEEVSWINWFWK